MLKYRCWLSHNPNPCKHCFSATERPQSGGCQGFLFGLGSDFRWHFSSSPTHPLESLPPPPLSCCLSLSLPLLFISILLYTGTSIDTETTCLQMPKSYGGPRSQHDAKNHALYLPGVAWDLRPAWSHRSPTLGQGTGDCHDPHGLGLSTALKASPLPPLPSPWERVTLIAGRDTPDSTESAPHSQSPSVMS